MKKISVIALTLLIIAPNVLSQDYTTKMIVELWRHGARVPAYNTFQQDYVAKEGPGNIVGNGMRMHYLLGQQIREDYKELFQDEPQYNYYEVTTSDYQRTKLSAVSHLMGIYPLGTGKKLTGNNAEITKPPFKPLTVTLEGEFALDQGAKPIPLNVVPLATDDFFMKGVKTVCPGALKKTKDLFKAIVAKNTILDDLGKQIESTGWKAEKYFGTGAKYDLEKTGIFADVDKCYYNYFGVPMADTDAFYDQMKWAFGIYYVNMKYPSPELVTLHTSKISQYILQKMQAKMVNANFPLRYAGLSGHEANIFPFMLLYKLTSEQCMEKSLKSGTAEPGCHAAPHFAANFIWELAQKGDDWFVKARFNGDTILKTCKNPNVDNYCTFKDFSDFMTEHFILSETDFKKACGPAETPAVDEKDQSWKWAAIVIGVLFIAQLIFFLFHTNCSGNKKNKQLGKELMEQEEASNDFEREN